MKAHPSQIRAVHCHEPGWPQEGQQAPGSTTKTKNQHHFFTAFTAAPRALPAFGSCQVSGYPRQRRLESRIFLAKQRRHMARVVPLAAKHCLLLHTTSSHNNMWRLGLVATTTSTACGTVTSTICFWMHSKANRAPKSQAGLHPRRVTSAGLSHRQSAPVFIPRRLLQNSVALAHEQAVSS